MPPKALKLLLLTPPMTQVNTPYPATAYLMGFLRSPAAAQVAELYEITQADPGLELFLNIFSQKGLARIRAELDRAFVAGDQELGANAEFFLAHADRYLETIDAVIGFLQGRDPTLAWRITGRQWLPEGRRFAETLDGENNLGILRESFGALGTQDQAKHLASLYIDEIADVIRESVDPKFALSRYGEKLAASTPTFDPILEALAGESTLIDEMLDEVSAELFARTKPDVVAVSAPFPGNIYGAFRMLKSARALNPNLRAILGGGYPNTELRSLDDPRVFDYFDYITLDDGERPLLEILTQIHAGKFRPLKRTFVFESGKVVYRNDSAAREFLHREIGAPTYEGLPLNRYVSLMESLNPMQRLWSDGRWNKLTLAHGCYWKKCSFCDVTLDYIGRYETVTADLLVDRIEAMIQETGERGFHFVDEAAPPAILRALSERLIERNVSITWWGNIRFEKTFTPELVELLARAGCVAVSGGLEVASDRLLKLMNKGVTVDQVARVTKAFTDAGVMVHAYLMYGFPTQTERETLESLEMVRQLFAAGCIQSAFWHRFSATIHSPVGKNPDTFGIEILDPPMIGARFAQNDLQFYDPTDVDHDALGVGLRRALYNFMRGAGLDLDVRSWFDQPVPKAQVPKTYISKALRTAIEQKKSSPKIARN